MHSAVLITALSSLYHHWTPISVQLLEETQPYESLKVNENLMSTGKKSRTYRAIHANHLVYIVIRGIFFMQMRTCASTGSLGQ